MPDRAALATGASGGIARVLGYEGYGLTVAARRPQKLAAAAEHCVAPEIFQRPGEATL